jgi:hypothetical protein
MCYAILHAPKHRCHFKCQRYIRFKQHQIHQVLEVSGITLCYVPYRVAE